MKRTNFLRFLMALVASTSLCAPSYGMEPCPPEGVEQKDSKDLEDTATFMEPYFETYLKNLEREEKEGSTEDRVTLQETLEQAYMQNTDLDAARAHLRATDEDVSQAIGQWRPSVSVEGQQNQRQNYPIGSGTRSHTSNTSYQATISQNVYQGGQTVAAIGEAESDVLAEKASLFDQEQSSLLEGVGAHSTILQDEAIVIYQKQSMDTYKKLYERAQARYEVGEGSRTDVEAAKGQYEGAKAELSQAIGDLESAKARYKRLMGVAPGNLASANVIIELPKVYEEALEVAKTNNPLVIQARYRVEAALYNVDFQLGQLLPSVDVDAFVANSRGGGTRSTSTSPKHPKDTKLGFDATLTVPIYLKGIPNSQVRQAYQLVAQQKVQYVGAMRQVEENAKVAWDNMISARESVKGFLAQVKAQELSVEGALEEVNVGTKTVIDVLVLQNDLISAQISLAQAQAGLVNASYQVLQAMGRLTARDLKLRVKYYDPDAYYNEYKNAWIQFWKGKDWSYVKDEVSK
jgi:outer membrane protein